MLLTVINQWEAPPLLCATTHARWHLLQQHCLQNWHNIVTEKHGTKCSEFPGSLRVIECGPSSLAWVKSSPGIAESWLWTLLQWNPRGYIPTPFLPEQLEWLHTQFGRPVHVDPPTSHPPPPDPTPPSTATAPLVSHSSIKYNLNT